MVINEREGNIIWSEPSFPVKIDKRTIHCWTYFVGDNEHYNLLYSILSDSEKTRAEKFIFEKDRLTFVYAHGLLRLILSSYLQQDAQSIQICTGENGKPYLADNSSLFFNISHSGTSVLFGFSDSEIGVDIEIINHNFEYKSIISSYFTQQEIEIIESSKDPVAVFYQYWTRKEAILKAFGTGLYSPLQGIDVCLPQCKITENNCTINYYLSSGYLNDNYVYSIASIYNSPIDFYKVKLNQHI